MPGRTNNQPYIPTGDPKTSVQSTVAGSGGPFKAEQDLGGVYNAPDGARWQKVQYSSVLTAAAAAKTIVYWKDPTTMTVDTDLTDSESGRNACAGAIITGATLPVALQAAWVLQEDEQVTLTGITATFTVGEVIFPSATQGQVDRVAAGTASTYVPIGTVHTTVVLGAPGDMVADINIPSRLY